MTLLNPATCNLQPVACVGPTGVGKSALSTELALRLGGEVVGADAFQLYHGLPLLTAQPLQNSIPHHLIGVIPITEECDAMRYRSMVLPLLEEIASRNRIPIITGGTGFYLKALLSPLDPLPPADLELRSQLSLLSREELVMRLQQLDPEALLQIDINNRRRVERALEIVIQTGKLLSETWKKTQSDSKKEPIPGLFLTRDRDDLHHRIETNVQTMFNQGVVDEVAVLDGIDISRTAAMTLGLREIQAYRRGEMTLPATIAAITQSTKRYAKRQMTWFRNQHNFRLLNLTPFSSMEAPVDAALQLLEEEIHHKEHRDYTKNTKRFFL